MADGRTPRAAQALGDVGSPGLHVRILLVSGTFSPYLLENAVEEDLPLESSRGAHLHPHVPPAHPRRVVDHPLARPHDPTEFAQAGLALHRVWACLRREIPTIARRRPAELHGDGKVLAKDLALGVRGRNVDGVLGEHLAVSGDEARVEAHEAAQLVALQVRVPVVEADPHVPRHGHVELEAEAVIAVRHLHPDVLQRVADFPPALVDGDVEVAAPLGAELRKRGHQHVVQHDAVRVVPALLQGLLHVADVALLADHGDALPNAGALADPAGDEPLHGVVGRLGEAAVEQPGGDHDAGAVAARLAVDGDARLGVLVQDLADPLHEAHHLAQPRRVVLLDPDPLHPPVEALVAVGDFGAEVKDEVAVGVLGVEEAADLLDRVGEVGVGADGGAAHGDARVGDVGEVEGEAVLVVHHALLHQHAEDEPDDLEHAQAADDSSQRQHRLGIRGQQVS
mmetsp:Transcript_33539/g.70320  ORF Transcript_33539/g.70320 Transcript_33539/m.70320 type:complete len:453 (-) Transcript_33539:1116-2474(-)